MIDKHINAITNPIFKKNQRAPLFSNKKPSTYFHRFKFNNDGFAYNLSIPILPP